MWPFIDEPGIVAIRVTMLAAGLALLVSGFLVFVYP
jgi:hypothetical protein